MKVTVNKIDDINFIMSGTINNSVIEGKVAKFKEQDAKEPKNDESADENIEQAAAGEVFKEFIDAGIKEANIDVESILGQPGLKKYEQKDSSVYFEVELAISPEINVDIDYADIVPNYTKPTAAPEVVEAKLVEFAQQQAPFTKIEIARPIENGDVAVIDFTGFVDNKTFEGGSAEKFNLKVGSNSFIPGFEEQLIGMEYNQEKDVIVSFPDDYSAEDLAGKEARFIVKLHEIQEQKPERLDDAFAQKIFADKTATLDKLRNQVSEQATAEELSKLYMSELKPKVVEGLLAKFDFTLPNNIVEQEIDAKVREKTRSFSEEQHKSYMEDKGKFKELRESVREEARKSIKMTLIVEALAKKEGIEVHEQEVIAALGYQATMTGQDPQKLLQYYQDNNLMISAKMGLTEDKLFGVILGFHKA
ncbi:trigger factor [Candidatus Sulfurimonas marisnigri]|uniref:Trigger factor n=1 Tax=Candidatus Sulfurimonas marisnigri TaxID=2740405 RepID=A0A7S7M2W1_9BACT|nr:trigger factor [Candidatus Sulfurimonas marisnigri]QOY55354.1 trigger factor [Candidatus Sulfurimonas marisnigri]